MRVLAVSGNTLRPPQEAVETAGRGPMSHLCGDDEETANLRPHYHIAPVLAPVSGGSAAIPAGGGSVPRRFARMGFSVRRPGRIESRGGVRGASGPETLPWFHDYLRGGEACRAASIV